MPILAFLGRRLAIFAVSLLGASLLVFAVCSALPGQVAEVILGEGATPAQIDALTAERDRERGQLVDQIEDLRTRLNSAEADRVRLNALLADQRERVPRRGFWVRLLG